MTKQRAQRRKKFRYGMKNRGFSVGCQPMEGFMSREDDPSGKYYDIITYSRRLLDDEIEAFELDDLNRKPKGKLTILREQLGVRQDDLAETLGVSMRTIQGWEFHGMNKIPLDRAVKVARALGINVEELLDDEEE